MKLGRMALLRIVLGRLGWCRTEQNWVLNRRQRIAYTVKAVVCIVLGRKGLSPRRAQIEVGQGNHHDNFMFGNAEWDVVLIGAGRRSWRYTLDWDCT